MAKISKEKIEEINAKSGNGFFLDIPMAVWYNDKRLKKYIQLSDSEKLEASLSFYDRRVGYTCKPVICLHLSIWETSDISSDMLVSKGLGATIDLSEPYERKKFADIIKLSHEITDEKIMQYAAENMQNLRNPFLVGGRV